MPAHLTDTAAASSGLAAVPTAVALDGVYAADLADLLRCLHEWIDAEHDELDPLLAKHDHDIVGLRVALDLYTSLLTHSADEPSF